MSVPKVPQVLALSYKLFVRAENSQQVNIGQCLTSDLAERRDITSNFVIGNDPPDQASNLIPGVVRERSLGLRRVRLYNKSLRQAFGRDDQSVVASLSDQSTPVDLVMVLQDPNTSKTKTVTLKDGFLGDIRGSITMEGDIREMEQATFHFVSIVETEWQ